MRTEEPGERIQVPQPESRRAKQAGDIIFRSIRTKILFLFATVHAGFLAVGWGLYLFIKAGAATGPGGTAFTSVLVGACVIYFGLFLGVVLIYLPVAPWIKRYHALARWRGWILAELPTLLALIPLFIALAKIIRGAWEEIKKHHSNDDLDLQKLAKVVSSAAEQADVLMAPQKNKARKKK